MISIDEHVTSAIQLTNSLVIKMLDNALAINRGLVTKHGMSIPSDRREWKYFKNLAGEKHSTNRQVDITVIELSEKRPLTRELLEQYSYTRQELLKVDSMYNEVLESYPDEYLYIQGCIYPTDKVKAIQAKDGTILNYNKNLVEENEYDLIKQIQEYIYNFLQRWHVRAYTLTDELYLPYIMSVLYTSLPAKIINLRLNNIGTNQVHSFHLEHFFRSNINIWEELQYLKPVTINWLYKNLTYLNNNIGKEDVMKTVIEKIITDNEIGIGAYYLRTPNLTPDPDAIKQEPSPDGGTTPGAIVSDINKPVFQVPELVVTVEPLNAIFVNANEKYYTIQDMVSKEISIGSNDRLKENINKIEQIKLEASNYVKGNSSDYQRTKILELSTYELFKRQGIDLFKVILDYWLYLEQNKKLNYVVEYIEPNDKKNYVTSTRIGILFLLKSMLELTGMKDMRLKELHYDIVMPIDVNEVRKVLPAIYDDGYLNQIVDKLLEGYPNLNLQLTSVHAFKDQLASIINWYTYSWTLDANLESVTGSANIKRILALSTRKGTYKITDEPEGLTIDELIEKENIIYTTTNNFDYNLSLQTIVERYTGMSIDEYKFIKEISASFKIILERMVSYTTQILNSTTTEDSIFTQYNNPRLYRPAKGVVSLNAMTFKPLEDFKGRLSVIANDFEEYGITTYRNTTKVEAKTCDSKPTLTHIINPDNQDLIFTAPVIKARVL